MAKLKENRTCVYCDCYIPDAELKSLDVHYSHTKRHTKQYFHYHCWRKEMDIRIQDKERIRKNKEERKAALLEYQEIKNIFRGDERYDKYN